MTTLRLILSLLILSVYISFSQNVHVDSSLANAYQEYINPSYSFPSPYIKEKGYGYPYPSRIYPGLQREINKLEKFLEFCDYIKKQFTDSDMTIKEAEEFYGILEKYLKIRDEYYGMPAPNSPEPKPVKLKDRVMIKKLNDTQYVIFYYEIGCGCTYIYSEGIMDSEGKINIENIEVWKENNPC
jgi:hypothetical protein